MTTPARKPRRRNRPGAGPPSRSATPARVLLTARVTAAEAVQARERAASWGWSMATLQRRALGLEPGPVVQACGLGVALVEGAAVVGTALLDSRGEWRCWRPSAGPDECQRVGFGVGRTVREAWEGCR